MKNRFVEALERTSPRSVSFDCPRTGLRIAVRQPTRKQVATVRSEVQHLWADRELKTRIEQEEYLTFLAERTLAVCAYVEGEDKPIGLDALQQLDEVTLRRYDEALGEVGSEPALEEITEAELAALLDLVKKNEPAAEVLWRTFGAQKQLALLLSLVERQTTSTTLDSSSSSSGGQSSTATDPGQE